MLDLRLLSLALDVAALLIAVGFLLVAVDAPRTIRASIAAMTANTVQRAVEHDIRLAETIQCPAETTQSRELNHAATTE